MADVVSNRWAALEKARLTLARIALGEEPLRHAYQRLGAIAARLLDVERVSIWDFDVARGTLQRVASFDARPLGDVEALQLPELGRYAGELERRRVLVVRDVATEPLTEGMTESYCKPLGIVSMLDAPVYSGGVVVGLVCHEHRGKPRAWTDRDADLAVAVAEVVSALRAQQTERALELEVRKLEVGYRDALSRAALARGGRAVAHDMNNLIAVVRAAAELIVQRGQEESVRSEAASTMLAVSESAERLCDTLLGSESLAPRPPLAIDEALGAAEATLAAIGAQRRFRLELGAPGARVEIEPAALDQIALNLVANAREATAPGEGAILVRTSVRSLEDGERVLCVEVHDNGAGIDAAAQSRLSSRTTRPRAAGAG